MEAYVAGFTPLWCIRCRCSDNGDPHGRGTFSYEGVKTTVTWAELLAGIKVNVATRISIWDNGHCVYRIRMNIKGGTQRALVYSRFWKEQTRLT